MTANRQVIWRPKRELFFIKKKYSTSANEFSEIPGKIIVCQIHNNVMFRRILFGRDRGTGQVPLLFYCLNSYQCEIGLALSKTNKVIPDQIICQSSSIPLLYHFSLLYPFSFIIPFHRFNPFRPKSLQRQTIRPQEYHTLLVLFPSSPFPYFSSHSCTIPPFPLHLLSFHRSVSEFIKQSMAKL